MRARAAGAAPQKTAREELLREHFDTLAALFDPGTFSRIVQLGIGPGWRCWEVGAGGGSVAGRPPGTPTSPVLRLCPPTRLPDYERLNS